MANALTKIQTNALADDAVTGAKIADDTVAEANMANDAISLTELKAGTDGQIITWDASGNPTAVGPGTDGQVLTSTGAGSPPTFEDLPASGPSLANDANNRVITATGSGGLNAESSVTYDGNTFLVGGEYLTLTGTGYKQLTAATTTNNSAAIKLQNSAKNYTITNVTGGTFQIAEASVSRFQIVDGNVSVINSDFNVSGVVTATNFVGNLSGIATGATRVYIDESEDDSNFYNIPFLDSTDPGDRHHALQVDHASFQYNPAVNALLVDRITPRSGQALQLDNGGLERARVHTNGNFGINNTSPTSKLDVGGDAKISGVVTATDFDATSDIRLKTNVQPIEDPIAKVIQIEGVSFNWKKDNRPALGVIADQVEKVLPQLVHGDDPKTVNYNGLVGLLIEVVKDQQKQIDTLSERLSKLE